MILEVPDADKRPGKATSCESVAVEAEAVSGSEHAETIRVQPEMIADDVRSQHAWNVRPWVAAAITINDGPRDTERNAVCGIARAYSHARPVSRVETDWSCTRREVDGLDLLNLSNRGHELQEMRAVGISDTGSDGV